LLVEEIMPNEIRSNRPKCKRIDCSSDTLVERSLASILEEKFPNEGENSLLVADEYHMLTKEHKEELLEWVAPRLSWLKVVMLANRSIGTSKDIYILYLKCLIKLMIKSY
jgi:hypothetical protein